MKKIALIFTLFLIVICFVYYFINSDGVPTEIIKINNVISKHKNPENRINLVWYSNQLKIDIERDFPDLSRKEQLALSDALKNRVVLSIWGDSEFGLVYEVTGRRKVLSPLKIEHNYYVWYMGEFENCGFNEWLEFKSPSVKKLDRGWYKVTFDENILGLH